MRLLPLLLAAASLPAQIQLPEGLRQTLPIEPEGSYFGDAVRFADCPEDKDNPLGLCGNTLFGGYAMYLSQLRGDVTVTFYPPVRGRARFDIEFPSPLSGADVVMTAPQFYRFPVRGTAISTSNTVTTGEVDLRTGEISNLVLNLGIRNSFLEAVGRLNPNLRAGTITFPYVNGTAIGKFENRPDGLLDLTLFASTFVPTGNLLGGEKVRMPLPGAPAGGDPVGFEAPGSSLRPRLRLTTRASQDPPCAPACPELPLNTTVEFAAMGYHTSLGDAFHLDIPDLGGDAVGRSHLSGRFEMQFGSRYGDVVPVSIWALPPGALLAEPPPSPLPGFGISLLGHDERLVFPNFTYEPKEVALSSDPFDTSIGIVDLRTGRFLGDLVYRGFPAQDLLFTILALNGGRVPPDSFRWRGPARFERAPNGGTYFRMNADVFLDFSTFIFPEPDYNPARGWRAGPEGELNPFLNFEAYRPGGTPASVRSGQYTGLRSSFGDTVSLGFSIPCAGDGPASFEYTNGASAARGGTFRMETLGYVNCFNSRQSTLPAGSYDTISFTGFGTWSKDDEVHLATVQVSEAEGQFYWSVQVDGGLLSNANNKPPQEGQFVGNSVGPPPP
ncbi:MAG: hypothetical protein IPM24_21100 [Bryobacterales bacterium]|nr:hypothetical protein [Bryobacterales bacterium]